DARSLDHTARPNGNQGIRVSLTRPLGRSHHVVYGRILAEIRERACITPFQQSSDVLRQGRACSHAAPADDKRALHPRSLDLTGQLSQRARTGMDADGVANGSKKLHAGGSETQIEGKPF